MVTSCPSRCSTSQFASGPVPSSSRYVPHSAGKRPNRIGSFSRGARHLVGRKDWGSSCPAVHTVGGQPAGLDLRQLGLDQLVLDKAVRAASVVMPWGQREDESWCTTVGAARGWNLVHNRGHCNRKRPEELRVRCLRSFERARHKAAAARESAFAGQSGGGVPALLDHRFAEPLAEDKVAVVGRRTEMRRVEPLTKTQSSPPAGPPSVHQLPPLFNAALPIPAPPPPTCPSLLLLAPPTPPAAPCCSCSSCSSLLLLAPPCFSCSSCSSCSSHSPVLPAHIERAAFTRRW